MADQLQTTCDNLRSFVAAGRLGNERSNAPPAFVGCISGLGRTLRALEVVWGQAGVLRDASQHPRPDFLIIMEAEDEVGPVRSGQRPMGTGLRFRVQPRRRSAAKTRRAFAEPQLVTLPGT
jgi:hypothetical protein